MEALAVVMNRPGSLWIGRLPLTPPGDDDVVVDIGLEQHQHRHGALAVAGSHAAVPWLGLSAGSRI